LTVALTTIALFTSASEGATASVTEYAWGVGDGGGAVGLFCEQAASPTTAAIKTPKSAWFRVMVVSRIVVSLTGSRRRS
jgi:hypothetical protein